MMFFSLSSSYYSFIFACHMPKKLPHLKLKVWLLQIILWTIKNRIENQAYAFLRSFWALGMQITLNYLISLFIRGLL